MGGKVTGYQFPVAGIGSPETDDWELATPFQDSGYFFPKFAGRIFFSSS
jgi:hypothetical protein